MTAKKCGILPSILKCIYLYRRSYTVQFTSICWGSALVSSLLSSQLKDSTRCRAEIQTRACHTASRRTINWDIRHNLTELRHTLTALPYVTAQIKNCEPGLDSSQPFLCSWPCNTNSAQVYSTWYTPFYTIKSGHQYFNFYLLLCYFGLKISPNAVFKKG